MWTRTFFLALACLLAILPGRAATEAPLATVPSAGDPADLGGQAIPLPALEIQELRRQFFDTVYIKTVDRLSLRKKELGKARVASLIDEKIQRMSIDNMEYIDRCAQDILQLARNAHIDLRKILYFLYIDRSRDKQLALVGFFDARNNTVVPVGLDLVSSGHLGKDHDYFLTPVGVFENTVENFGYRALGTPNQDGWLGLGAKGSRVWDFGFQRSLKPFRDGRTLADMRLLVHATDPVQGEKRLGRVDSKGCVRVSAGMNEFLDRWAILDANYEEWARTRPRTWLLRPDRTPVRTPGRYLFIGDSSAPAAVPPPLQGGTMNTAEGGRSPVNSLN